MLLMKILNEKTVLYYFKHERHDKEGTLFKTRLQKKNHFKKRYFVLCGNILAYYERRSDVEPLGVIFLEGHSIEMVDDLTFALKFPFIKEKGRDYYLRAESPELLMSI
ncbi:unnamed protein product [Protopolystoma xenopodis]|uniref:PH domain-containing protein n=1 Tax=Protopolystoma xenopodis TaxID=117903 RepID=A0A448WV19_9PLAT|nr:unnamed protein product [Protopolystoma xenopodis]